ncbi:MAG: hypothetical protein AAFX44_12010 [Pseudomonadota bacterium]
MLTGYHFPIRLVAGSASLVGLLLLGANVAGLFVPMRATEINGYVDFANEPTRTFDESLARLNTLGESSLDRAQFVTVATQIFHEGIAHVAPDDVRANGFAHYGMRVPATENWVLYVLSFLKPDTYMDYEFCSYKRALKRGTGRCGQQSLALVSFLSDHGIPTGFVALEGHAIATAQVDDESWYLLDPDYGGVIPYDIAEAEKNPSGVLAYYWSDAARLNRIDQVYAPINELRLGGTNTRYPRACPIEQVAYVVKWALPPFLLVLWPGLRLLARRRLGR